MPTYPLPLQIDISHTPPPTCHDVPVKNYQHLGSDFSNVYEANCNFIHKTQWIDNCLGLKVDSVFKGKM